MGMKKNFPGGETETTNNRMELLAVIRGLEALTRRCRVDLYTDSQYVQRGVTEWMQGWKKKDGLTGSRIRISGSNWISNWPGMTSKCIGCAGMTVIPKMNALMRSPVRQYPINSLT
jgi:hypothetical protein